MPLVKMSTLLKKAREGGYAVGSFSVSNMEMVLGVLKAVEETKSPAIPHTSARLDRSCKSPQRQIKTE